MQGREGEIVGWTQYLLPIVFLGLIVWAHYILFIGDEREMADCSKTDVFLEELDRMCKSKTCSECKLSIYNNYSGEMGCDEYMRNYWYDAIKAVQEWSDEHSKKKRGRWSRWIAFYIKSRSV